MRKWNLVEEVIKHHPWDARLIRPINKLRNGLLDFTGSYDAEGFKKSPGQKEKGVVVKQFTSDILQHLSECTKSFQFDDEVPAVGARDRFDLLGSIPNKAFPGAIVIEVDAHRADQVAKKFVSRSALLKDEPLVYVAIVYPGTKNMNSIECGKYFKYCSWLSEMLTRKNHPKAFLAFRLTSAK